MKKYSRFYSTICANVARVGFAVGTGRIAGVDPREMGVSDLVVIWGTNPVNTQVNVMTHAMRARKERGARIAAIDIYNNDTMKQADIKIILRPGTDGAFACGVMHVLFREGLADRDYLDRYTDCPGELEQHLATRTPEWASAICGVPVEEIESFARAVGQTRRTFFRLGYGFTRSRNGAAQMHAASCIPAVTGAWQYEGGGAFFNNLALWHFDESLIEGHDAIDRATRILDQSQIGRILTGDAEALQGKGPVKAMLIQNTNPMTVAPEQALVRRGFARDDLFVAVHEQFMTETAQMADIVLPATMFMEHDDLYYGGGHQHISVGPKLIDPPGECRSNHEVLQGLGRRLAAVHPAFAMTPRELIDATLKRSGHGDIATLEADLWRDLQPDFRTSHYLDGFAHADKKFHFKADWAHPPTGRGGMGPMGQDAVAAGSLGRHRGDRRRASVPAGDQSVALLPQYDIQRNAVVAGPRGQGVGDDPSARCGPARHRRRRHRDARQQQGRDHADRTTVRRRAARRPDRGIDPSEPRPHRRPRHQRAHRRRYDRADRRRRLPRQQGLGEEGRGRRRGRLNRPCGRRSSCGRCLPREQTSRQGGTP